MRTHRQLPLAWVLALRAHLGRQRALSLLTILAIAGSVSLATGLEMSSRGVEAELARTARAVAGAAEIEVVGGTLGVSESLLAEVAAVPGVRLAAPFVQATFRVERPGAEGTPIHVLGIDLVADAGVRSYSGGADVDDPLRLISGLDSVLVAQSLADRLGLRAGDSLPVRSGSTPHSLTVRGTLSRGGLADAFGGQVAVMDVYALQHLLKREGWLDRVDVVVADGAARETVMAAVAERVRGRATVRHSGARDGWLGTALQLIRTIVLVLVAVAVLVASLVSYSALSLFVDRRVPELALLRTAGLEPRRVRRFLYLDAALLALVGTIAGGLFGRVLSQSFLAALSWVSGFLQGVEIERLEVRASTLATGVFVGGLVSFAGVFAPARRATQRSPLAVLLRAEDDSGVSRHRSPWPALIALGVAGLTSALPAIPPLPRLTVTLAAGLFGLERLARAWLPGLLSALRGSLEIVLPGLGRLGAASLAARPAQTSLAVVCVAGVVAGVTMSLTLGEIGAANLDGRMSSVYPGGILVTAGRIMGAQAEESISADTITVIRDTPRVRAVFEHTSEKIVYRGEEVLIVGANMDVLAAFGRLSVVTGDPRTVATKIALGEIAISDGFARRFGARVGDSLTLDTPKGARSFRIAGLIHDFAGPAGSINIDLSIFDELWLRHGARDIVFWTDGDPEPTISEIRRRIGDTQSLFFVHGDALTHYASGFLRQFRGILMSVALLTALLGGVAVWNLMLSAVTGRARELALLMCIGATERQLRALTLIDGALLGLCGGLVGIPLGILGAYSLVTRYIADALGWTLTFTVDPLSITALIAGLAAASLLATLYPAWVATRVPMREASSAD